MIGEFRKLFRKRDRQEPIIAKIEKIAKDTIAKLDFDDPATRAGISLHFVLSKQFDLIGKREGEFPYVPPFASDKARGALLGTAIAIVHREYGDTPHQAIIDATIAAFTLTFGSTEGAKRAWQTMDDAAQGNDEINFASDWAIKDTKGGIGTDSVTTPVAYYLAVGGMI